jgi:signal transduction histidine kinase
MLSLSIGPLLVFGLMASWRNYTNQAKQALTQEQDVAKNLAFKTEKCILSFERDLQAAIRLGVCKNTKNDPPGKGLADLQAFQQAFEEIILLDAHGQEQARHSQTQVFLPREKRNLSLHPMFTWTQKNKQTYFGPIRVGKNGLAPMITLSVPIVDLTTGRTVGALAAEIRLKKILDFIGEIDTQPGRRIYIVDDQHQVIARDSSSMALASAYFSPPNQDGFSKGLAGNDVIIAQEKIHLSHQNLYVISERDEKAAMKFAHNSIVLVLVLLMMVFVVVFVIGVSVVHKIVIPIKELAQTAQLISRGEIHQRAHVHRHDEIGGLAQSFNHMTEELEKTLDDLRQEIILRQNVEREMLELNENLERRVEERTGQLRKVQARLLESAHKAGMADIATEVLHNVGNVLNSVVTSSSLISQTLVHSNTNRLLKLNKLVAEHLDDLASFFVENPKGKQALEYYQALGLALEEERISLKDSAQILMEKSHIIMEIISSQQDYAIGGHQLETCQLGPILDDAIQMQQSTLSKHGVQLNAQLPQTPQVKAQRFKVIHIIINLLKNAKEAMADLDVSKKRVSIELSHHGPSVRVNVTDTGVGISKENLNRLFQHGFTTKAGGHGFGLHSSANYMLEMNGRIFAESPGEKQGATFILEFPIPDAQPERKSQTQDRGVGPTAAWVNKYG